MINFNLNELDKFDYSKLNVLFAFKILKITITLDMSINSSKNISTDF